MAAFIWLLKIEWKNKKTLPTSIVKAVKKNSIYKTVILKIMTDAESHK